MMEPIIDLTPFQRKHIPVGMKLKTSARWNQVELDWHLLLHMSAGGSFVATYQDKPVGTTLTIEYPEAFSWIGMVLVDPHYRGKGIGTRLLKAALAYALPKGAVLLDATALGQPLYHSLGFQGIGEVKRLQLAAPIQLASKWWGRIKAVKEEDLAGLMAYDQQKTQFIRSPLIKDFFQREPAYAWMAYQQGQIVGYTLGRTGSHFHHIGPMVVDKLEIAQALLAQALAAAPVAPLIIDVPTQQEDWYTYLLQQGFSVQRSFSRMCLGPSEKARFSLQQYAIAGPALG